jgi:uncharacterized protein YlaI
MKKMSIKKRKLLNSTGKCYCDICNQKEILEDHHINGRKIPNYNNPANRCNICPNCHTKVHKGLIIIEQWLMTSEGLKLFWHEADKDSFSGWNSKPYIVP